MFDTVTRWFFALWPYLSLLVALLAVGWATIESVEATRARKEVEEARTDARYWMTVAHGLDHFPSIEETLPRRYS